MAQSVKLADDVMKSVRAASQLHSRSIAGQITHWINIGRAIEQSTRFDHARVSQALAGKLETRALSEEEKEVWSAAFLDAMDEPGEGEEAFYAQRRAKGVGVGLDKNENVIRQKPDTA
ncbi:MAG: hypothetical protein AAF291_08215 [Pseudomonadota bacterium]